MKPEELKSFYIQRKNIFTARVTKARKEINIVSNFRLLTAGAFLVLLYFAFTENSIFYALPIVLLLFVVLVLKHGKLFQQKTHLENLVTINENEVQSIDGNFSCFYNGAEFINAHHPYTHDLDIFGEGSLFQYINRSTTLTGTAQLAGTLASPLTSAEAVTIRQQAIKELADKIDFRQHFLATGKEIEEYKQDKQQLIAWTKQKPFLYGSDFYRYLLWIFPAITIFLIVAPIFIDAFSGYVIICVLLQWVLLGIHLKKITAFHEYISRKKNILDKYARLLRLFREEKFQSSLLNDLSTKAIEADKKVNALASLMRALDARLNFMTNLIVNSVLLYDLQCIYRLEKWKEDNSQNLITWMDVISETDMLCSMATFTFNHADFTFPIITPNQKISATDLGHPLIAEGRITNDVTIGNGQSIMIITGANMAGKSTFLRTIGINMVLALNGMPVCAQNFSCPIISMRSGMRTADSLQDHKSYFYAELDRLKTIMDELRSGKPLLILLDEILKGTNSTDKQAGSIALVKQLLSYSCLGIIATHDLALGDLEKEYPAAVKNYCFEPTIENDQLSFDYKLKQGLAQKMNATFLMRKMGIIPNDVAG